MPELSEMSAFLPLLDHLAHAGARQAEWQGWRLTRIGGAGNNLLYRATNAEHDLAIKFVIRDQRDRAGREYHALLALQQSGRVLAPAPLWLERERYPQPVVVQTWLEGEVVQAPPTAELEWQRLLDHYLAIHSLTPQQTSVPLADAVLDIRSSRDALDRIRQQLAYLPSEAWPTDMHALVAQLDRITWPEWPAPEPALCRNDPNTLNIIRRAAAWASVDWENSGWSDPLFELADLMTHPAYAGVPAARWEWLIQAYCARRGEHGAETRVRVYYRLMLVWWVVRLARMLYEIPRGADQRLSGRPTGWEEAPANYQRYLRLARQELGMGE